MLELNKIIGGRGKCRYCNEFVNNVSYHEDLECIKNNIKGKIENMSEDNKNNKDILKVSNIEIKIGDKTVKIKYDATMQISSKKV